MFLAERLALLDVSKRTLLGLSPGLMLGPGLLLWTPVAFGQTYFEDVTLDLGVAFEHADGSFTYAMGGGAAWLDYDRDGDDDLLASSSDGRHGLFRNEGSSFTDVSASSGLFVSQLTDSIGSLVFDHDSDGWIDIYFTNADRNELFRNAGDGTFDEIGGSLGIDSDSWTSCAAAADFDLDGDLDLYLGNYIETLNFPYHFGAPNQFFRNVGTATEPAFEEQAVALGIDNTIVFGAGNPLFPQFLAPTGLPSGGCTLSVVTPDHDEDGDPDLMVGNDFGLFVSPNRFFRNDFAPGTGLVFADVTTQTGFDVRPHYNMGIAQCDFDHDGDWDYYKSSLGDNLLLRNDDGLFTEVVYDAGPVEGQSPVPGLLLTSWGTVFQDLDNDGWEDLYVSNGLIPAANFILNDEDAPNGLHLNNADGTFTQVPYADSGADDQGAGRGVAWYDVDRDGLLDFYQMNNGAPGVGELGERCALYRNTAASLGEVGSYARVRLRSRADNWEAIGSRLVLEAGDLTLRRQITADQIYLSSPSREVHFGLGDNAFVDRVSIDWQTGVHSELVDLPAPVTGEVLEPIALMTELLDPVWIPSEAHLRFQVRLVNTTDAPLTVSGLLQIALPDKTSVVDLPSSATLPPGETLVTQVLRVAPEVHALFEGQPFRVRAYVVADGGVDSRALDFLLP